MVERFKVNRFDPTSAHGTHVRNQGPLPLGAGSLTRLAVLGPNANAPRIGGGG